MNETRNQLLNFRSIELSKNEQDKNIYMQMFLESYERELQRKKETLQEELKEIENNMKLLQIVKKDLNIKSFKDL